MSRGRVAPASGQPDYSGLLYRPAPKPAEEPFTPPAGNPDGVVMMALRAASASEAAELARVEAARIAALPKPLSLADIVAPEAPDLSGIDAYLKAASRLWAAIEHGSVAVPPDATLPIEPPADPLPVRTPDGRIDIGATVDAKMAARRAHAAAIAAQPRVVALPKGAYTGFTGPTRSLAQATIAFEDLRASIVDAHERLVRVTAEFRAAVEAYHADVDAANAEYAAEQQATVDRAAAAEAEGLADVVATEARRQELLAKARKLGVAK